MKNITDKNVIIIIFSTILIVFVLIFSIRSPERKVIDSPIIWKEDFSNISILKKNTVDLTNFLYV